MVIAEAILAELPVIMTDVGVAGELVEDNINGFIIPVNDVGVLKEKMQALIDDKDLFLKFRKNSDQFKNKILIQEQLISKIVTNWQTVV